MKFLINSNNNSFNSSSNRESFKSREKKTILIQFLNNKI